MYNRYIEISTFISIQILLLIDTQTCNAVLAFLLYSYSWKKVNRINLRSQVTGTGDSRPLSPSQRRGVLSMGLEGGSNSPPAPVPGGRGKENSID